MIFNIICDKVCWHEHILFLFVYAKVLILQKIQFVWITIIWFDSLRVIKMTVTALNI